MSAIGIERVRKAFGSVVALHEVSLTVADQEFLVLLGPSGCGKTTLLRIIAGLESATSGRVRIGERDVTGLPPRERRLAMVFQNYAVFPHMTVAENIAFGLRMQRAPADRVTRLVGRSAEMMHISHLLERYPGQLSGGQRQRVAVARALAVEPDVLLMDEPLSNLDALLRLEMRAELKHLLAETKTTTIYVTHDQVEAMSLADRIAVMRAGDVVQVAAPMVIYSQPADTFVGGFIGNPPMNFIRVPQQGNRARLGRLELPVPASSGDAITLGVRPEELEPAPPGEGFEANVVVAEPLGPHVLLTLAYDGQQVRYTAPPTSTARPGDVLTLRPTPAGLRWLDADTGRALS
jgi:multiple sugar transport system ATP-binding protein